MGNSSCYWESFKHTSRPRPRTTISATIARKTRVVTTEYSRVSHEKLVNRTLLGQGLQRLLLQGGFKHTSRPRPRQLMTNTTISPCSLALRLSITLCPGRHVGDCVTPTQFFFNMAGATIPRSSMPSFFVIYNYFKSS